MTVQQLADVIKHCDMRSPSSVLILIAENVYAVTFKDGRKLAHADCSDVRDLLNELAEELRYVSGTPDMEDLSAKPSSAAPRRLRLDGSTDSRFLTYCNSCSHIHQDEDQCGVDMGPKAGKCGCRMAVTA
jgi:hypothetical protein